MTSAASLVEAKGSSHHHDHPINVKSKFTSPLGLIQAHYNKDGPTVSLQKKKIFGGALTAGSPKLESFDLVYNTKVDLNDGKDSFNASIGLNAPIRSLSDYTSFLPRAVFKYMYGQNFSATVTSKFNKTNEAEIIAELNASRKFDVTDSVKGILKADVKHTIYNDTKSFAVPAATFSMMINEKTREYGCTYATAKKRLGLYNALFLPTELKMPWFINFCVPTAVGLKIDIPVEKLDEPKKWSRSALMSFSLAAKRSKDAPTALNLMLKDNTDVSATLLRRDQLKLGDNDLSAVYSLSAKANLREELGLTGDAKSGPVWGFKVDLVGDVQEFPLANAFNIT